MDKKSETPVSEMDDQALQIHALGLAYRDAERRCAEAKQQAEQAKRDKQEMEVQLKEIAEAYYLLMKKSTDSGEEVRQLTEKADRERQESEAQLKEMAEAYHLLMKKNGELTDLLHKKQEEIDLLRRAAKEKPTPEKAQERGKNA